MPKKKPKNRYRSSFEETIANLLTKVKVKFEHEPCKLTYTLTKKYIPDFVIKGSSGTDIYIETKGHLTQVDREKMLAVKKDNPSLDIRFVFMRASNKLTKASKTTYGQWADKHGFLWADGVIPHGWYRNTNNNNQQQ